MDPVSGLVGLAGVVLGSLLTLVVRYVLARQETSLRLKEKVIDRRIDAHLELLDLVGDMRETTVPEGAEKQSMEYRVPGVLSSQQMFANWWTRFSTVANASDHWLDGAVRKEVYFIQDYLVALEPEIADLSQQELAAFGTTVRPDFIKLAKRLEEAVMGFLSGKAHKLAFKSSVGEHKHPKKRAERLFRSTALYKQHIRE